MTKLFYLVSLFCFCSFSAQSQQISEKQNTPATVTSASDTTLQQTNEQNAVEPQVDPDVAAFMKKIKTNKNNSFSYELVINEKNKKRTVKIFKKNEKIRMEIMPYDGVLKDYAETIFISNGKESHAYLPKMNIATKADTKVGLIIPKDKDMVGYVLAEKTKMNGWECQMLRNHEKGIETCINEKFGLPVYGKEGKNVSNIINLKEENLKDELFNLPAEVSIF